MAMCDYCGKVGSMEEVANGRTRLLLCLMCKAEWDWKQSQRVEAPPVRRSFWQWLCSWFR